MCTDGETSCGGGSERAARGEFFPSHLPSTRDALQRGIQSYWIRAPAQAYTSPSIPNLANVSWAREGHFHLDVGAEGNQTYASLDAAYQLMEIGRAHV